MEIECEADFREFVKTTFTNRGAHVTNIESSTKNGIPDVYICEDGDDLWLELKTDSREFPLIRKEQRVWGVKHNKAKGKSFVVHYGKPHGWCSIYKHPIVTVRPVGKYLEIRDEPEVICMLTELCQTLREL